MANIPSIQTQNPQQHPPPQQNQQQYGQQQQLPQQQQQQQGHQPPIPRQFSPPSYPQAPRPMSPSVGGMPPAKRMRTDQNPPSPYTSPFSAPSGSYSSHTSPYTAGPTPASPYLNLPHSPAAPYPPQSFHQPQPYQHHNDMNQRPPQGSMPPPKVPASKAQDGGELEKANSRDLDVNNISDVLTGSGIDLRAEEEYMTHSFGNRNLGNSFNSQASASTISPHGSFNWSQGPTPHGAFQGTGPLSQPISEEQLEAELVRKHEAAVRALADSQQAPLTDPFLLAGNVRQRVAMRAYQNGINVNLEGLFDRIPDNPQSVRRTTVTGPNGESVVALQSDSLLNQTAPFVEILSLMSLAAEDRLRTILEDAFALAQGRRNTSHGVVPPNLVDVAAANGNSHPTTAIPTNISKTAWEEPDSAVSPMTVADKNSKSIHQGISLSVLTRYRHPHSATTNTTHRCATNPTAHHSFRQSHRICSQEASKRRLQIRTSASRQASETTSRFRRHSRGGTRHYTPDSRENIQEGT